MLHIGNLQPSEKLIIWHCWGGLAILNCYTCLRPSGQQLLSGLLPAHIQPWQGVMANEAMQPQPRNKWGRALLLWSPNKEIVKVFSQ